MLLKPALLLAILVLVHQGSALLLENGDITLDLGLSETSGLLLKLTKHGVTKMSGRIGANLRVTPTGNCEGAPSCVLENDDGSVSLNITSVDSGFDISWVSQKTTTVFQDCLDLNKETVNWFGGPEIYTSEWPIENMKFSDMAYGSSKIQNRAVAESYWLNSNGAYVLVDERAPLFLDQNNLADDNLCLVAKAEKPYTGRSRVLLKYVLVAKADAKEAQIHAVKNYLGQPTGYPNNWIIEKPIWTTWAKYKVHIDDVKVLEFAKDIIAHNYTGQLEIDDLWETCYGSLTFNDNHFANINSTVKSLKDLGFTVTLWTHPFVNDECEETTKIGRENDYFIKSKNGSDMTAWWNGNHSHHIDFTKEEARNWWKDRLQLVRDKHGIDSFKFDAGEYDWAPEDAVLNGDVELAPNWLTTSYVETCASFGDLIEVRSAWRSQKLPMLVRMLDKDSRWGLDNGLHNLITSLLQMNVIGYGLVLPDMIGGNGYGTDLPTPELLVRWTQANTFMPNMQFSYLPWELTSDDFDSAAIVKKYVDLHEQYAPEIIDAMKANVANGTPVNGPVWWLDPTNSAALEVNDEYLLGEKILVAPVIKQGATSRDVFLPAGTWKDANTGATHAGPILLPDYDAPIDVLPYFIKQ